MKTNNLKNQIRKALKESTQTWETKVIVLINNEHFRVLYKDTLITNIHGTYDENTLFIYHAGICKEIIESKMKNMLPEMLIIAVS